MSLFARWFQWLLVKPASVERSGSPALTPIDTDRIARELDLEQEARRLGEAGLPAADQGTLSGIEAAIVRRVEKARQDYLSWGVGQLAVLNQDIQRRDLTALVNQAGQADREFERRASALVAGRERLLAELAREAAAAEVELEDFRARHGLRRPPRYPGPAGVFFGVAVLVLLAVVEGALNAALFAKGVATGLVGGFIYAGGFAFGNVAIAYLFGRWALPNLNHRNPLRKCLGGLALPLALAAALAVGLLIAHFRDALAEDLDDAPRAALESLRRDPLGLKAVHSWALLGVSLVCAVVAMGDAYRLDDPYPGYAALDRRRRRAQDDYGLELEELRAELETLKDASLTALDRALAEARAVLHALHQAIEQKRATGLRLQHALADVDHCLDTLLGRFRDLNRLYRSGPAPAYFAARPPLAALPWPDFSVEQDLKKYAEQAALLSGFVDRMEDLRGRIQASFVRRRDGLLPLDAQFRAEVGELAP